MDKVGVGVITCDRPDMFDICFKSIKVKWYDEMVVVDDGKTDHPTLDRRECKYIKTNGGEGVGKAKNAALRHLMQQGCDYIILVEDDMEFDKNIFAAYIEASKQTGIQHFMFAYHGPANKANISYGKPVPRKVIDYGDVSIALNQHCVGAVTFYTKSSLTSVGLYDEGYTNAFEHVDHSYMLAQSDYSTPYWWWADIANSLDYVHEQKCSEDSSAIRPRSDWKSNIQDAFKFFINKHGVSPVQVPDTSVSDVIATLKRIYEKSKG
jgi:glycosyltransferase involved in cell wall biosynthesis